MLILLNYIDGARKEQYKIHKVPFFSYVIVQNWKFQTVIGLYGMHRLVNIS